jgi:hypothetical protein
MALYLDITENELQLITEEILTLMGGFDINVDLTKEEVLIALRMGLLNFEKETAIWQLSNQFLNAYGLPAGVKLSNQLATVNFGLTKQITDWFASMHRIGGKIPWHKDYITLEPGRQIYFLDKESSKPYVKGTRRIHRVMWVGQPEIFGGGHVNGINNSMGEDVLYSNAWNFNQSGANYAGNQLGFLGYTFDTVMMLQAAETRNSIRFSEFFHNLSGDVLEITPMPGQQRGIQPGMRVFYYYFNESEVTAAVDGIDGSSTSISSDSEITPGDIAMIGNPLQMKIDLVPWSQLSAWAQIFIKQLAFARCKYMQASKWRKIKKTFATGDMEYEIEFDYDSLLSEAKDEEETLISNLREDLKALNIGEMLSKQAEVVESAQKINSKTGRLWKIMLTIPFIFAYLNV